jgi:CRP-like cAMP-binding protein
MERRVTHSLVNALRAVPSFAALDDRTMLAMVGDSMNLFWPAGSKVFARDTPADGLYLVLSGAVRVLAADGAELNVLRPGDYFGELSMLLGTPHQNDVEAIEDTELMVVAKERFEALVGERPELAASLRRTAEERLAANTQRS